MNKLRLIIFVNILLSSFSIAAIAQEPPAADKPDAGTVLRVTQKKSKYCPLTPDSVNLLNRDSVEVDAKCSAKHLVAQLQVQVRQSSGFEIQSCFAFQVKTDKMQKSAVDPSYNCTPQDGLPRSGYVLKIAEPPNTDVDIQIILTDQKQRLWITEI